MGFTMQNSTYPDRYETLHYLHDLKELVANETSFITLNQDYVEFVRSVLNYSPVLKVRELTIACPMYMSEINKDMKP